MVRTSVNAMKEAGYSAGRPNCQAAE